MIDLDTRWPLAAIPVHAFDPWLAGRVAVYDLAACVDAGAMASPALAALVCDGLRAVPSADLPRVLRALDDAGSAAVVVGVLVGAVLRMERDRLAHAFCCGADVRRMPASLALKGVVTVRAGAA